MLSVLGEADTAGVGHNGDVEFGGHEEHGDDLVHATETAGVDLADVDGAGGEELLEHDAILAHLSSGDADAVRLEGLADGLVAENLSEVSTLSLVGYILRCVRLRTIIRRSRLLDEPWLEFCQVLHVLNRLRDAPDLVGIDHEHIALVEANDFSCDGQSLPILSNVTSDLELEMPVALSKGLLK